MTKRQAKRLNRGTQVYNSKTGEIGRVLWMGSFMGVKHTPLMIEIIDMNDGSFDLWPNSQVQLV